MTTAPNMTSYVHVEVGLKVKLMKKFASLNMSIIEMKKLIKCIKTKEY